MNLAQKELFIFDLDGTLFNSLGDLAPAVNYAMRQFGLKEHSNEQVLTFIGNGSMNLIRRAVACATNLKADDIPDSKILNIHKVYSDYYREHCTENTVPYEGVVETLCKINAQGKTAAMLTNKPIAPAKKILEKFNLSNKFAMILCGDTAPERKPSPKGIFEILHQTGIAPEKAVMIGDDTPDVMAAQNANIDCIALLHGFGKPENLLPLQPKWTAGHIKDFAELV